MQTEPELYSRHFLCAPLVFLDYLSFGERFVIGNPQNSTHPAAQERRTQLESYIWKKLPPEAKEFYAATKPFWTLVEKVKRISTV